MKKKCFIIFGFLVLLFICLSFYFYKVKTQKESFYYLICREPQKLAETFIVNEKKKEISNAYNFVYTIDQWDDYLIIFTSEDIIKQKDFGFEGKYTINRISGDIDGTKAAIDYKNNKSFRVDEIKGTCEKAYKTKI